MYFLLKMGIIQPAMLVYQRVNHLLGLKISGAFAVSFKEDVRYFPHILRPNEPAGLGIIKSQMVVI